MEEKKNCYKIAMKNLMHRVSGFSSAVHGVTNDDMRTRKRARFGEAQGMP